MMKAKIVAALVASVCAAAPALAHEAGDFIVRVGAAQVAPDVSSSSISAGGAAIPGTKATVGNDTQLGAAFAYMITDRVGVELLAATPFKHQVNVKGVAPSIDGKFADVKHLPPTLSLQYYLNDPKSAFQPYVGVGLNFTTFFNEKLTSRQKANGFSDLSLDDSWGAALQIGMDYKIDEKWMLNAAVWKMDIDTTATARLGGTTKIKVDVDIDPWVYMVGVGYRF